MTRTLACLAVAAAAAGLYLLWGYEHDHTGIRAPWTGLTLAASALGFVAVGIVGRGWRALLATALVAGATMAGQLFPWRSSVHEAVESCDPACISLPVAVLTAVLAAVTLTVLGIGLRRATVALQQNRRSQP